MFSICKQINALRIDRKRVHSADVIVYISMAAVIRTCFSALDV